MRRLHMLKVPPYKKQRNRKIQPTAKTNIVPFQFTSFPTPIFFCHECVKWLQRPRTPGVQYWECRIWCARFFLQRLSKEWFLPFHCLEMGWGWGGGRYQKKCYSMTCTNPMKFKFQCPYSFKGTQPCPPLQAASGCSHTRRAGLSSHDKRPHAGLTSPQCHSQALQLSTTNCRLGCNATGPQVPYAALLRFIIPSAHPTCQNKKRKSGLQMLCF